MADSPKKPRKIKDLKARLGKTISPNTPKAGGGVAPPPNLGAGPAAPPGAAPAPGGIVPPSVGGAKKPAAGGVVKPPFVKSEPPPGAKPAQPSDPFSAVAPAAAAGPQQVRLVIDESAVADSEVGRAKKGRNFLLLGLGLALGLALGYGGGSVMSQRKVHNIAVRDGKSIFDSLHESSAKIDEVQRLVDGLVAKARGGPGKAPSVDYDAIRTLVAIEKPFQADVFSRRHYSLFEPATVDSLFKYYNGVNHVFDRIQVIDALTRGEERQTELNQAAENYANMATSVYGCVFAEAEGQLACKLGFVTPNEGDPSKVMVRPSRRSRHNLEKSIFNGSQDLSEDPGQYVVLVDRQGSSGILGESASLFAEYVRDIAGLKALIDETVEIQGRLETSIGQVASNDEVFAL